MRKVCIVDVFLIKYNQKRFIILFLWHHFFDHGLGFLTLSIIWFNIGALG